MKHGTLRFGLTLALWANPFLTTTPAATVRMVSSTDDAGPGTLRAALQTVQRGDTIKFDPMVFPPEAPATVFLSSGLPALAQGQLTIDGTEAGVILDGSRIGETPELFLLDDVSLKIEASNNILVNGDFSAGLAHWSSYDEAPALTSHGLSTTDFHSAPQCVRVSVVGNSRVARILYQTSWTSLVFTNWPLNEPANPLWIPARAGQHLLLEFWYKNSGYSVVNFQGRQTEGSVITLTNSALQRSQSIWLKGTLNLIVPIAVVSVAIQFDIQHSQRWQNALNINSSSNIIRGLQLVNFPGNGLDITGPAANNNVIGGDRGLGAGPLGQGNLISGNGGSGITLHGAPLTNNVISGNFIGTDLGGVSAWANFFTGISLWSGPHHNLIGGSQSGQANLISGHSVHQISFNTPNTANNVVTGNLIGTDVSGSKILGGANGISIEGGAKFNRIGGASPGERNVISGLSWDGIYLGGIGTDHNTIEGNYIGLDAAGTTALGNGHCGIEINNGAQSNVVGGTLAAQRNVISGQRIDGLWIGGANTMYNRVLGNYIGTDPSGAQPIPNQDDGIHLDAGAVLNRIGGSTPEERNVISGNANNGTFCNGAATNSIAGNFIGVDASGKVPLGNGRYGINLYNNCLGNLIGGTNSGEGNLISANRLAGIASTGANSRANRFARNSIYRNGGPGITNSIAAPRLVLATTNSVTGRTGPGFTVEIFSDDLDEGRYFEGAVIADATGNFSLAKPEGFAGPRLTATAADLAGSTSPFSTPFWISNPYVADFEGGAGPEWSVRTVETTPVGNRHFLGRFGNQTVSLSLTNLPIHNVLILSFDLFVIQSWDGNDLASGPDIWQVSVTGGATLLTTTFCTHNLEAPRYQAFPESYPGGRHPVLTGASATNSLGYTFAVAGGPAVPMDTIFHLTFSFAHEGPLLKLNFTKSGQVSPISDESWGLDDVQLSIQALASNAPPAIVVQPQSQSLAIGGEALFQVVAASPIPLRYRWLQDGQALPGATNSLLVLPELTPAAKGTYTVEVSNDFGLVNSQAAQLQLANAIFGYVYQAAGKIPLPRANVRITPLAGGAAWSGLTDARGRYLFPNPPEGAYRLQAQAPDFLATYYDNVSDPALALPVTVNASNNTPTATFVLSRRPNVEPIWRHVYDGLLDGTNRSGLYWGAKNWTKPTFVDIDGDGDADFFAGNDEGTLVFFRNDGTPTVPVWTYVTDRYNGIIVDNAPMPAFADIDGDGDYDLFIGRADGRLSSYRNVGTSQAPVWLFETNNYAGITMPGGSSPCLVDIDGDGDLDLFVGRSDGHLSFYRNEGTRQAPAWKWVTHSYLVRQFIHGTRPVFADIDGDGDYDLFVGGGAGVLSFYRNEGTAGAAAWRFVTDNYTITGSSSDLTSAFVDIDGDGDLDMFTGEHWGVIIFYRNDGNRAAPKWTLASSNYFPIDLAGNSAPAFGDLDGDGDLDLVIGQVHGGLEFYRNDSDYKSYAWTSVGRQIWLPWNNHPHAYPTLADIDADGRLDLLVGQGTWDPINRGGNLFYYRNNGTLAAPAWSLLSSNYAGVAVGAYSVPALADIDGDGDLELFVGKQDGRISFYRNDGTPAAPLWKLISAAWAGINVGSYSAPTFCDLDGDGDYDLFVGNGGGTIWYYRNNGTPLAPVWSLLTNQFLGIDVGLNSVPAFADLDGNNRPDLIVGEDSGGLNVYLNLGDLPPKVTSVLPLPGSAVPRLHVISATFDKDLQPSSLNLGGVRVVGSASGNIAGSLSYDAAAKTLTFVPAQSFAPAEWVIVTLTTQITDLAGNGLDGNGNEQPEGSPVDDFQWNFLARGPATLVVTNIAEDGPGSLRRRLAEALPGDAIGFDPALFPPANPTSIRLTQGPLPSLVQGSLTFDASQAGVILDGSALHAEEDGLSIASASNIVKGLQIAHFPGNGIALTTPANLIGGAGPGEGNALVGNGQNGLKLLGSGAIRNLVCGNWIGSNGQNGICLAGGASTNQLGGELPGQANVVTANQQAGVALIGFNTRANRLAQNSIYQNGEGIGLWEGANRSVVPPVFVMLSTNSVSGLTGPGYTVELFSDAGDQGRYFEGSVVADGAGHFVFDKPAGFVAPRLTATATDLAGNTSVFTAAGPAGQPVYRTEFTGAVGPEWSIRTTATTPVGNRRFLGQFGNQNVSLTLSNLPPHNSVTLAVELFVLKSWDGNWATPDLGPDLWSLRVLGGPVLLQTTFNNHYWWTTNNTQAFPGSDPGVSYRFFTGASQTNTLGYTEIDGPPGAYPLCDAVYQLTFSFDHASNTLGLSFSATGLEAIANESWGLASVVVQAAWVASNAPPAILVGPRSQRLDPGADAAFGVVANGATPLRYQWQHLGMPLSAATNSWLVLTNLADDQAGDYRVEVSNPFGSALSDPAVLELTSVARPLALSPRRIEGRFQFTLKSPPARTYQIQTSTNLLDWSPLLTGTNTTGLLEFIDPEPTANYPQRFYRALVPPLQ